MLARHPDPLAPLPGGSDAAGRGMAPGSASLTRIPGHSREMDLESTSCLPFPGGCGPGPPTSPSVRGAGRPGHVSFSRPISSNHLGCKVPARGAGLGARAQGPPTTAYEDHPEVPEAASRHTLPAKARQRLMGSLSSLPSCCSTF